MEATSPAAAIEGRIALVTGASRGIGAASAVALAGAGAHVILTARDARALEAVEETIHAAGGTATIAPLDLTQTDGISRLAAAIAERWGKLDLLMLNAAMLPTLTPVGQIDQKSLATALTLNFLAPQALLAALDAPLRRSDAGRVLAITSSVGAQPRAYWGAYGATKAALENLVLTYGEEVGRITPVRVALVDPGATRTKMRAKAYPGEDPASVKPPEAVAEFIVDLLRAGFPNNARLKAPEQASRAAATPS